MRKAEVHPPGAIDMLSPFCERNGGFLSPALNGTSRNRHGSSLAARPGSIPIDRFSWRRSTDSHDVRPFLQTFQVDWALGSMLYEINALPWSYVPPSDPAAETSAAAAGASAEDRGSSSSTSENVARGRWGVVGL